MSKPGRHFAVLGTMLELGSESALLHQKVLKRAIELGLTGIVFVSCDEETTFIENTIKEIKALQSWAESGNVVPASKY